MILYNDEKHIRAREYMREWRKNNPEKIKSSARASYLRNIEVKKNYDRKYRIKNREIRSEYNANYYKEHRNTIIKRCSKWLSENKEKHRVYVHKRRATIKGGGGSFSAQEWNELQNKHDHKCLCCGKSNVKLSPDHVISLAHGGSGKIENIQPLCQSCNCSKRDKDIDYR